MGMGWKLGMELVYEWAYVNIIIKANERLSL